MSKFSLLILILFSLHSNAQEINIFKTLNWDVDTGTYSLDSLNADFEITDDELLLRGRDTYSFMEYVNGLGVQLDGIIYRITGAEIDSSVFGVSGSRGSSIIMSPRDTHSLFRFNF